MALTDRHRAVLSLLARGYSPKQIEHRLQMSQRTYWRERTRILERLGVETTEAAVAEWILRRNRKRRDRGATPEPLGLV